MQYGFDENDNNNIGNETKRETKYSINNNNTRYMHVTKYNKYTNDDVLTDACVVHMNAEVAHSAHYCTLVHVVSHHIGSSFESCH